MSCRRASGRRAATMDRFESLKLLNGHNFESKKIPCLGHLCQESIQTSLEPKTQFLYGHSLIITHILPSEIMTSQLNDPHKLLPSNQQDI